MSGHRAPGLGPRSGFDWARVSWGGPDEPPADTCSYCDAAIAEGDVPLVMWNADGWTARFCDGCMKEWWGFSTRCRSEDG